MQIYCLCYTKSNIFGALHTKKEGNLMPCGHSGLGLRWKKIILAKNKINHKIQKNCLKKLKRQSNQYKDTKDIKKLQI